MVLSILGKVRSGVSQSTIRDIWRADFGLFRSLVERVPWEMALKGKGVQAEWAFFKNELSETQEWTAPMCCKRDLYGEQLALLDRELL